MGKTEERPQESDQKFLTSPSSCPAFFGAADLVGANCFNEQVLALLSSRSSVIDPELNIRQCAEENRRAGCSLQVSARFYCAAHN
jgi:hypothetical protein